MKIRFLTITTLTVFVLGSVSCTKTGKTKATPNDGQLHGVAPDSRGSMGKPFGMVYIPPGTFHMGPSDEDVNFNFTARNREISISGFWMDATEITNNQYRQFVKWTRDSLAAIQLGYFKQVGDADTAVDWKKTAAIKWADKGTLEKLSPLMLTPDNRIYGKMEIDPEKSCTMFRGSILKRQLKLKIREEQEKILFIVTINRFIRIHLFG